MIPPSAAKLSVDIVSEFLQRVKPLCDLSTSVHSTCILFSMWCFLVVMEDLMSCLTQKKNLDGVMGIEEKIRFWCTVSVNYAPVILLGIFL